MTRDARVRPSPQLSGAEDPSLATTHLEASCDVAASVVLSGSPELLYLMQVRDGRDRMASARRDRAVLIMHSNNDNTIPVRCADELRDMCVGAGIPHEYHRLVGTGHNIIYDERAAPTFETVYRFVVQRLGLRVDVAPPAPSSQRDGASDGERASRESG